MKFVCLGYYDEKHWGTLSESEQFALMDACFAYDDVLKKGGHFLGGEGLQSARSAATLRPRRSGFASTRSSSRSSAPCSVSV